jgi:sec-independent protein translocase protein TatA
MFDPSAPHIIILLVVVLLLFGSRRLPGAARSLGESMHIFKKSVQGINPDDETAANPPAGPAATQFPPYAPAVVQPAVAAAPDATAQQLADLQRQLTELQQQQAAGNAAVSGQAEQAPTAQPF